MPITGEEFFSLLWLWCFFPTVCAVVRKSWIEDFLIGIEGSEDHEMWLRLSAKGCRMHYITTRLGYYRQHPANATKNVAIIDQGQITTRVVTAIAFPEKVGIATAEIIKALGNLFDAKNAWSSKSEKDIAELLSYKERLEANQANQEKYITELETAVTQKNAHIQALEQGFHELEQRLSTLETSKVNRLINRVKKLKG
jgi:uncharacterized coiled-coil protein SlyX